MQLAACAAIDDVRILRLIGNAAAYKWIKQGFRRYCNRSAPVWNKLAQRSLVNRRAEASEPPQSVKLTSVYVKKYSVSALLPTDVFPDATKLADSEQSVSQR